jgi:hypothetical protein
MGMKELFEELLIILYGLSLCVLTIIVVYTIIIKFNT